MEIEDGDLPPFPPATADTLRLSLLGPLSVQRAGVLQPLPASRKVRGLLAYLALADRPVARGRLCELLWDGPGDPRGELRWCLSRMRRVLDDPVRRRVEARGDAIRLSLEDCAVDALALARASETGLERLDPTRLRSLAALPGGDFLEGLEIDRSPVFAAWLTAQRRRFQALRCSLLQRLSCVLPAAQVPPFIEQWVQLAPFDTAPHVALLQSLVMRGRIRDGERHAVGAQRGVRRACVAVMPFEHRSAACRARGGVADALVEDVITRLAKLRSLRVIAQGSVFALHARGVDGDEAARLLDVDYLVTGVVRSACAQLDLAVELTETATKRIVWAERFERRPDDVLEVLAEIGDRIVGSVAGEIELAERNRAILQSPETLDAWGAYHRGLWHMYRFDRADNALARGFFETSLRLDPTFSRAHAGHSFTHFQNAFQGWGDRAGETGRALESAGRSLMSDGRDPAAHWAMGRALWLLGRHPQAVVELEQAVELSPNFALGHYTLAFVHAQDGDPEAAIASSDLSRELSPCDPLLFGMLGARAIALVRLERFEEAAVWAVRAAARPNAHAHILAIAAFALALAGETDEARLQSRAIRSALPRYGFGDFLRAYQLDAHVSALFLRGARLIGMS